MKRNKSEPTIARVTKPKRPTLLATASDWESHWWGMPSYVMGDATPPYRIIVSFNSYDDLLAFGKKINRRVSAKTQSINFSESSMDKPSDYYYE